MIRGERYISGDMIENKKYSYCPYLSGEEYMPFSIVIDGPNFISRLKENGYDEGFIIDDFDFGRFHDLVQKKLGMMHLNNHPFVHTYFICSKRRKIGTFDNNKRDSLLKKVRLSRGITVIEVEQHVIDKSSEKGVDMTVLTKSIDCFRSTSNHEVVILTQDTDFVPAIECLTRLGAHVIIGGFFDVSKNPDEQLINVSYDYIDLKDVLNEMKKDTERY